MGGHPVLLVDFSGGICGGISLYALVPETCPALGGSGQARRGGEDSRAANGISGRGRDFGRGISGFGDWFLDTVPE